MSRPTERWRTLAAALAVIGLGLVWRSPMLALPPVVAKYGGSILWGAMVFLLIASLLPRQPLVRLAALAAIIAAGVELSQLVHIEPLDAFRATRIGALLLGRVFSWWDILAYWVGIAAVWAFWARLHR